MKFFYKQESPGIANKEEAVSTHSLSYALNKTRIALDQAYAGFDNATEAALIDSYIFEINALTKRYEHLSLLAKQEIQANQNI